MKNDKKDKKVGIMTLFNCYNYGAVLQAYATYKYVKMLGYTDVELIDYENKFEAKSKKTLFFIFSGNIKHIIKKIIQYIILGKNRNLKKAFKSLYYITRLIKIYRDKIVSKKYINTYNKP